MSITAEREMPRLCKHTIRRARIEHLCYVCEDVIGAKCRYADIFAYYGRSQKFMKLCIGCYRKAFPDVISDPLRPQHCEPLALMAGEPCEPYAPYAPNEPNELSADE